MKYYDFINSTEYQKKYSEVVSLGFNCWTSTALRQLCLQHKSYPFDWGRVVEENRNDEMGFRRKMELICIDFKDFINESDLCINETPKELDEYFRVYNTFNGMHFFHDFPKEKTISESYPLIKEKYDRRIKRLIDLINSGKKICFVFYSGVAQLPKAEIIYCTSMFYKIFPNANVDFLILQNDINIVDDVIYEKISDTISCVSFYNGPYDDLFQGNYYKIGQRLKQICNAMMKTNNIKKFSAAQLNSDFQDNNVITNQTPDYDGILSFGPYTILSAGNHIVTVDYEITENYDGFVDIVCDQGKTILLPKTELPHNQNEFKINLHLDKLASDLEVRFFGAPRDATDETNKFKLFGIKIV